MDYLIYLLLQLMPIFLILYFYVHRKYSFWSQKNVPGPKPSLRNFGNVFQFLSGDPKAFELEMTSNYGPLYGHYAGLQPVLTITDPKLIKQVLVKNFDSFTNRREMRTFHELVNMMLFFTEDPADWKKLRSITSSNFTSSKLRKMNQLIDLNVDKLSKHLQHLIFNNNGIMETKSVIVGFTLDVIALTMFGTEINTNNSANSIATHALNIFNLSSVAALSYMAMPKWFNRLIGVKHFFNKKSFKFFEKLSREIVQQRKESNTRRNDLADLLINSYVLESDLKNTKFDQLTADMDKNEIQNNATNVSSQKTKLSENEVIAMLIAFFIGGFETTTSTITNIIFELTRNASIQDRLFADLSDHLENIELNSEVYYETILTKIPYLDAVVKEALRKYPPLLRLERKCVVEQFKLGDVLLKKGQLVEIPSFAIHHNSVYYPDPELFSPERFMPENKHLLVPYTHLPFGDGPKNCLGMRFAYQEVKLCIAKIIRQYQLSPTAETPDVLTFCKFKSMLHVEPFSVKVETR